MKRCHKLIEGAPKRQRAREGVDSVLAILRLGRSYTWLVIGRVYDARKICSPCLSFFSQRSQDEVLSTQDLVVCVLARPFNTGQGHREIFCYSGEMFSIHNDPPSRVAE